MNYSGEVNTSYCRVTLLCDHFVTALCSRRKAPSCLCQMFQNSSTYPTCHRHAVRFPSTDRRLRPGNHMVEFIGGAHGRSGIG